ncbi:MAG: cytochrome c [Alphaproteobacteria bacterium]|nr:cytochrome c [Alphaproteobacteria bacterium]
MRRATILGLGLGCLAATGALAATAGDVIKARQANYKQIGKANKAIMDELKQPAPSVAVIQANAKTLDGLVKRIPNWFPAGTGPETGVKTAALPAIWQQGAEFKKDARNMWGAANALDVAARSGDLARIRAAVPTVGASCKACHQTFRAKD